MLLKILHAERIRSACFYREAADKAIFRKSAKNQR